MIQFDEHIFQLGLVQPPTSNGINHHPSTGERRISCLECVSWEFVPWEVEAAKLVTFPKACIRKTHLKTWHTYRGLEVDSPFHLGELLGILRVVCIDVDNLMVMDVLQKTNIVYECTEDEMLNQKIKYMTMIILLDWTLPDEKASMKVQRDFYVGCCINNQDVRNYTLQN